VLNLALDWGLEKTKTKARVSYNVAGRRIDAMGTRSSETSALPDIYELPRHQVDIAVSQTVTKAIDVKLAVENVLNSPYRFVQGKDGDTPPGSNVKFPATTSQWRTGQTFWLSLIYNL
jgi:outer membrane receptor for ferrienterochelin and colicin